MEKKSRLSGVWESPESISLVELPMPELDDGGLLVAVKSCAICGSDIRTYKHGHDRVKSGSIVGHEISGEVVETRGNSKFKVGDRVAIGADVPCGNCDHCKSGRANCCDINFAIGHQLEGGFTEVMHINALTAELGPVHKIQDETAYDIAALAEPLACCINGYERCYAKEGSDIVIFGAGPIGMLLATLAKAYSANQVVIFEPNEARRANALKLGLGDVYDPMAIDPVDVALQKTKGKGADLIFTACPVAETHQQGVQMLAKRGVLNLFGGVPKTGTKPIQLDSNFIHYREAYVTGSHGSTPEQHKKAVELIEQGKVDLSHYITHAFPLTNLKEAYRTAMSGSAIKVVVNPS